MTVEYSVRVNDEVAAKLERIREEDIKPELVQTLKDLAERDDQIQQEQDELHEKMGSTDKSAIQRRSPTKN